jgi:CrcB protein
MNDIFLVSLGAILGANTRFQINDKLVKLNLKKDISILVINTFASFCLGLFLTLVEQASSFIYSYQLVLFFSIGFLGSLSTFSSFVYDLFDFCMQLKFSRALNLFFVSSSLGIIAFAFGFLSGNQ